VGRPIASALIATLPRPARRQVPPASPISSPSSVPAYRIVGLIGSVASTCTVASRGPIADQVAPPFVDR